MDGQSAAIASTGKSLSLIIPAYNEAAGILQAVAEADEALARLGGDYEILVVDDGGTDATASLVAEAASLRPRVRLLRHATNRGYGAALRTGFEAARFEHVAFTDADCQFHLDDLAALTHLVDRNEVVVGYRLRRQDRWQRRFYSWGYNLLVRTLLGTGVRDCDCALKVYRKEALARLLPESSGFFVNGEMLSRARQLGYGVAEVGVRHRPRLRGVSTVSLHDIPRTLGMLLPFWWSRVLFPGSEGALPFPPLARGAPAGVSDASRRPSPPPRKGGKDEDPPREERERTPPRGLGLLLLLVAGILFFSRLGCPLLEPDEARYAEIPRQMLAEGRFVVPVLHGVPYYQKPPLLYWVVMASYRLFGVADWAARLVPCGAAFLVVLVTYGWGRRAVGGRAAFAGALMLALSVRFVYLGRMLTMDSLLCLCVVAAQAAAHVSVRKGKLRWGWWLLSASTCGLGLLTKGPVALLLVAIPLATLQGLDRRVARPRIGCWLAWLAVALAVAAPWYGTIAVRDPEAIRQFFWTHNVVRYVSPLDHSKPAWFFLPDLLLGMLPWTVLLYPLVKWLGWRPLATAVRRPPELGFFLLTSLWCLLFFSVGGCKRPGYILPAMPPLALALGCYLSTLLADRPFRWAWPLWPHRRLLLARRAVLLVLTTAVSRVLLTAFAGTPALARGGAMATAAAGGFWFLRRPAQRRRPALAWMLCSALTFALLVLAMQQWLPRHARKFSLRKQVRPNIELAADPQVPVVCYPHRWDSVSFYLKRNDVRVFSDTQLKDLIAYLQTSPGTLIFIKSDDAGSQASHLTNFLAALPPSLKFEPRGSPGFVTAGWVGRNKGGSRDKPLDSFVAAFLDRR